MPETIPTKRGGSPAQRALIREMRAANLSVRVTEEGAFLHTREPEIVCGRKVDLATVIGLIARHHLFWSDQPRGTGQALLSQPFPEGWYFPAPLKKTGPKARRPGHPATERLEIRMDAEQAQALRRMTPADTTTTDTVLDALEMLGRSRGVAFPRN